MTVRTYLLSVAMFLVAAAGVSGQTPAPAKPSDQEAPLAPAFNLTSLEGENFELSALRKKIVVLNFWFTGCEPCVAEFPELNALVKEFKDKDVVFIAPTLDNATTLTPFLKEHKFNYHVVPNAADLIVVTYSDGSGNVVFPTHIVINGEGRIDTRVTGAKGVADMRKAILRLTSEKIEKTK